MNYCYTFPVVKGIQAGREYFIAMVPLKALSRLFPNEEEFVPPEYRAQRRLNEGRIPEIKNYIVENKDNYVFSALSASIDGEYRFRGQADEEIGILEIPMDSRILINDGQHRKAAIIAALEECPELGNETISVVFFADEGLRRSQQMFTDLNKHAVKTSNSIAELYDSRDKLAVITRSVIWQNEFLNEFTDKEKDNLGKFSSNLFTMNTFYTANKLIVGRKMNSNTNRFLTRFWTEVVDNMIPWQELIRKEITKVDLRENYIATQNVVIHAIGRVGAYFYNNAGINMASKVKKLCEIDWNRNARIWRMRAVSETGRIITNKRAAVLIANVIKKEMSIPLSDEEKKEEDSLKRG